MHKRRLSRWPRPGDEAALRRLVRRARVRRLAPLARPHREEHAPAQLIRRNHKGDREQAVELLIKAGYEVSVIA